MDRAGSDNAQKREGPGTHIHIWPEELGHCVESECSKWSRRRTQLGARTYVNVGQ